MPTAFVSRLKRVQIAADDVQTHVPTRNWQLATVCQCCPTTVYHLAPARMDCRIWAKRVLIAVADAQRLVCHHQQVIRALAPTVFKTLARLALIVAVGAFCWADASAALTRPHLALQLRAQTKCKTKAKLELIVEDLVRMVALVTLLERAQTV